MYLDYIFLLKKGSLDNCSESEFKIISTLPSASCQLKNALLHSNLWNVKWWNKTHTGTWVALEEMSFFGIGLRVSQSQSEGPTRNGWLPVQMGWAGRCHNNLTADHSEPNSFERMEQVIFECHHLHHLSADLDLEHVRNLLMSYTDVQLWSEV